MTQNNCKQLFIGLPGTGKTTFLAALWNIVETADVSVSLKLNKLRGNQEYLNSIREKWLECIPVERTSIASAKSVSMLLEEPETGNITEMFFPDMSGESFTSYWKEREWSKDFDNLVNEAKGALLFIHPDTIKEPTRIHTADMLVKEINENPETLDGENFINWNYDLAPTQVILVELLQFINSRCYSNNSFNIAIIISAWDLVIPANKTPEQWLDVRLPLLNQFLKANKERFPLRIYGVSAQGGVFPKDSKTLLKKSQPSTRVIIKGHDCKEHDLTAPIKWVMS